MALRDVLNEILKSELSGTDKKGLYRHAIFISMAGPVNADANSADGTVDRLEEALVAVGAGRSLGAAKRALAQHGDAGHECARRLGKLSRLRNGAAHPDVGLVTDISAFFCKKKETEHEESKHFLSNLD